jgi:hypothetical protein
MNRWIKPLLVGIGGLFAVMLSFSLFMPDQVMTSKWVRVANEKDSVIEVIADLKTWPEWNGLLTGAQGISFSDSTVQWTSANGKANRIKRESVSENGVSSPISIGGDAYMKSGFSVEKRTADSVQVVWFVIEELNWYPWEKFYGMMAADRKGPLMQESLDRLKVYLQRRP